MQKLIDRSAFLLPGFQGFHLLQAGLDIARIVERHVQRVHIRAPFVSRRMMSRNCELRADMLEEEIG